MRYFYNPSEGGNGKSKNKPEFCMQIKQTNQRTKNCDALIEGRGGHLEQ